jgi:hypothetical protein
MVSAITFSLTTCPIICAPYLNTANAVSPQHLKKPPAKRARVGPAKPRKVGLPKRGRGYLSELPTMPLDILFEVRSLRCLVIEATSEGPTLRFLVIFIPRTCFRSVA